MKKVLLIGNPNVGKSAIFSQLTGVSVTTSNYPGTTVSYTRGAMSYRPCETVVCGGDCRHCASARGDWERAEVIDVPGTYRLDPQAQAEQIAVDMIREGDILVNVVDATNLERNLNLTLQLLEFGKPTVVALNMWDEARHKGVDIDVAGLSERLGVPVIPTSGISGEGLAELRGSMMHAPEARVEHLSDDKRWERIGRIVTDVQNLSHRHHTVLERIQDLMIHPVTGVPFALLSLALIFYVIIQAGEFLVGWMNQLFALAYTPLIHLISGWLGGGGFFHDILLGQLSNPIDYEAAMGVLTTGVYVALGLVLPYVLVFYLIMGFLEDLGYLPRVAILFDRLFHMVGLHGYSILPMLLASGCNVPGVLAIRNLESRRERFITAVITCTTIPCMAQTAIILRAVGARGTIYVLILFSALILVWISLGLLMGASVKGSTPTLLIEVPPYRLPSLKTQVKKLWMRLRAFFKEAIPYMLGGILFINLLNVTGVIHWLGRLVQPLVTGVWGLPGESVAALILGVIRKDAAVALLEPLMLTNSQMVTATLVLILYFPCAATFAVLAKELGVRDLIKAFAIMAATTLVAGAVVRVIMGAFAPGLALTLLWSVTIGLFLLGSYMGHHGNRGQSI
jgi:ferrous iron transport protein B